MNMCTKTHLLASLSLISYSAILLQYQDTLWGRASTHNGNSVISDDNNSICIRPSSLIAINADESYSLFSLSGCSANWDDEDNEEDWIISSLTMKGGKLNIKSKIDNKNVRILLFNLLIEPHHWTKKLLKHKYYSYKHTIKCELNRTASWQLANNM